MNGQGSGVLVEDARCVTGYMRNRFGGEMPLILFGHSMGSLTARVYARQYGADLNGLILCGVPSERPALSLGIGIAEILKRWKGDRSPQRFAGGGDVRAVCSGLSQRKAKVCLDLLQPSGGKGI